MSKRQKPNRDSDRRDTPAARKVLLAVVVVMAVALLAVLGLWWNKSRQGGATPPEPMPAVTIPTNATAAVAVSHPEFQQLKGRWLRPDGGYIVEVKSVDDAGKIDAAYFNPRPIHVARAEASRDGGVTKVFIELRDVNYPGSTYTLIYDPAAERLSGIYFQAVMGQNFEVQFVRQP